MTKAVKLKSKTQTNENVQKKYSVSGIEEKRCSIEDKAKTNITGNFNQ